MPNASRATIASSGIQPGARSDATARPSITRRVAGGVSAALPVRATWQIGEASVIAEQPTHTPVVSDFRPADLAAGGQGAPLVPLLDFCALPLAEAKHRVLLNLGGIANCNGHSGRRMGRSTRLLAFDTGPANMVIDAAM